MEKSKWDTMFTAGVMIVLVYGIWSTRYAVNKYYHEGSMPSQKHEEQIEAITAQQQQILDLITQVRSDHEKMFKMMENQK